MVILDICFMFLVIWVNSPVCHEEAILSCWQLFKESTGNWPRLDVGLRFTDQLAHGPCGCFYYTW